MHHFEQPARRRVVRKSVECCDFCWISGGPQVKLAFQRSWNSRKQSETVGSGFKSLCFCRVKGTSPNYFQLFPVALSKKKGLRGKFFFAKKWRIDNCLAWSRRAAPDCFRLFPTVSASLEGQFHLWTTDSTKITTFNTFPHDPSACRLLEMMHFDFETQYTLKIQNPEDLVKFNIYIYII